MYDACSTTREAAPAAATCSPLPQQSSLDALPIPELFFIGRLSRGAIRANDEAETVDSLTESHKVGASHFAILAPDPVEAYEGAAVVQ